PADRRNGALDPGDESRRPGNETLERHAVLDLALEVARAGCALSVRARVAPRCLRDVGRPRSQLSEHGIVRDAVRRDPSRRRAGDALALAVGRTALFARAPASDTGDRGRAEPASGGLGRVEVSAAAAQPGEVRRGAGARPGDLRRPWLRRL